MEWWSGKEMAKAKDERTEEAKRMSREGDRLGRGRMTPTLYNGGRPYSLLFIYLL